VAPGFDYCPPPLVADFIDSIDPELTPTAFAANLGL
jgi:hypothetical protein